MQELAHVLAGPELTDRLGFRTLSPVIKKLLWLIVKGLHAPEEEDGVIRSSASC